MIDLENDDTIQIVDYVKVDLLTSGQLEIDDCILIGDEVVSIVDIVSLPDGYTLEVRKDWSDKGLVYGQFRGYNNCNAPVGLDEMVQKYIKEFNVKMLGMSEEDYNNEYNKPEVALPF